MKILFRSFGLPLSVRPVVVKNRKRHWFETALLNSHQSDVIYKLSPQANIHESHCLHLTNENRQFFPAAGEYAN